MPKYSAGWYQQKYDERLKMAHQYLGGKCSCGATENLHIHHKDPKEKSFTVTEQLHGMAWNKIIVELDKCKLLCEKCHKEFHMAKCGTDAGYGRGCRCEACKAAHRDYMRMYRKNKIRV